MREGDKWELYVPAALGYGEGGTGPIPGGAALIFEMELMEVGCKEENFFSGIISGILSNPLIIIGLSLLGFVAYQFMGGMSPLDNRPIVTLAEASENPTNA